MSLSSLIVEREIASIREVEEALARQVLYGGDFVTNLLEVCRVDEASLGAVVADFYGLATAPAGELPVSVGDASRVLPPEVAAQRSITALTFDATGIVLAVAEPLPREAEQELAFALAVPLTQKIAPLVRIRQALARDHGIPMDRRLTRLLGKMTGETPRLPSNARIPVVAAPPRAPSAPSPAPSPAEAPRPRAEGALATLVRDAASPLEPFKRRRGPLPLAEAQAELEEAAARDRIFDLVFDFTRQFFDYTAIFLVHGDLAEGRDGWGEGASRERVVRMGVPLDLPSVMSVARGKKGKVRAVTEREGLDAVLLADLGRKPGAEVVALPIVVRTRVVAMLLGDGGEGGLDEAGLAEVDAVVGHAVAAFERLIVRRKLQGTQPPPDMGAPVSKRPRPTANPSIEEAVQVVIARAQVPSVPPAAEELAAPVRELMVEQLPPPTRREARAEEPGTSEVPPPAKLLEVRRLSGPPIPREEPEAAAEDEHGPKTRVSGLPDDAAPKTRLESPAARDGRRRSSGATRKPEAPPLSFEGDAFGGYGSGYGNDVVEKRLLAEIEGREGAPSTDPEPPRGVSAPPPGGLSLPVFTSPRVTDLSPGVMLPAHDPDETPLAPAVASSEDDETPRMPPVFSEIPVQPAVVVSPVVSVGPSGSLPPRSEVAGLAEALKRKVSASVPPSMMRRDKPMPASEQQVSVAAHRPPISHEDVTRVLPSVIVDVEDEYEAMVVRALEQGDEEAEADLLRVGGKAMPSLMTRFPGDITVARSLLEDGALPRASECGPVLRLVAAQRRIALPHVLDRVDSKNDEERIWATYLLGELLYPEAAVAVVPRVFDENPVVRRVAKLALRGLAEAQPGLVVDTLGAIAKGREQPTVRRTRAVEALGETREATTVPVLASLVNDTAGAVANASRIALVLVTRHDFGHDARAWFDWWDEHGERHRLEWLIDALMSDSSVLRVAAGEELKAITKEYFGYYDDLPKREREKVQQRYRQWWSEVGRVRFSRSSAPRSGS